MSEMDIFRRMETLVHELAVEKGWWDGCFDEENTLKNPAQVIPEKIANIHAEVSEAWEEYRKVNLREPDWDPYEKDGKPEGFAIELADVVIRVMDLCCALDIDLQHAIEVKHAYNATRSYRHGGKNA